MTKDPVRTFICLNTFSPSELGFVSKGGEETAGITLAIDGNEGASKGRTPQEDNTGAFWTFSGENDYGFAFDKLHP